MLSQNSPRWVQPSSPNHPGSSLLPRMQTPLSSAAILILLPQTCGIISGQARFKEAQTIQSFSFPWSSTRKEESCYTSLGDEDPRQPNRQIITKAKHRLRTRVRTEPKVGVSRKPPAAASQGCCWQVNPFSTHLGGCEKSGMALGVGLRR